MWLVLASTSPRRLDLLKRIGAEPARIAAPDVDEDVHAGELPRAYVLRVALAKAQAVESGADEIVLAGDTTIAVGRRILAKPADEAYLRRMLRPPYQDGHCARESPAPNTGLAFAAAAHLH